MRTLQARGYITEVERDDGPGQAVMFGTTPELGPINGRFLVTIWKVVVKLFLVHERNLPSNPIGKRTWFLEYREAIITNHHFTGNYATSLVP